MKFLNDNLKGKNKNWKTGNQFDQKEKRFSKLSFITSIDIWPTLQFVE